MNMMNVATALNAGSRPAESGKKGKDSGEVTDDFKKLFKGKEDNAGKAAEDTKVSKKDVSQKKDAPEKKDDAQEAPVEETGNQEQNTQAAGLFAAYQLDQGFRPEVVQVEAEPSVTEGENLVELVEAPQVTVETQPQDVDVQPVQSEQQAAAQILPTGKTAAEKVQAAAPEETAQAADTPVVSRNTVKPPASGQQQENTQTDDRSAEQMVQVPVQQNRTEAIQETAPQETVRTVRMHVPQPEELPEKLTDQIISKMADGVKEFEIQVEPVNLGKIAVKITYDNGQANISIFCSEKKALDVLGQNVKEICGVIERNFGGPTTVILDKPENDYLNQSRDESGQGRQNQEQEQQKESKQQQSEDDAEQFLQKLRLGLVG